MRPGALAFPGQEAMPNTGAHQDNPFPTPRGKGTDPAVNELVFSHSQSNYRKPGIGSNRLDSRTSPCVSHPDSPRTASLLSGVSSVLSNPSTNDDPVFRAPSQHEDDRQRMLLEENGDIQIDGDNKPGSVLTAFMSQAYATKFRFQWQRVRVEADNSVTAFKIQGAKQPRYIVNNSDLGFRLRVIAAPVKPTGSANLVVAVSSTITPQGGLGSSSSRGAVIDMQGGGLTTPRNRSRATSRRSSQTDLPTNVNGRSPRSSGHAAPLLVPASDLSSASPASGPGALTAMLDRQISGGVEAGAGGTATARLLRTASGGPLPIRQLRRMASQAYAAAPQESGSGGSGNNKRMVFHRTASLGSTPSTAFKPPPAPPPPPGRLGSMLAKVQLNKNQDGSWQQIEAATSKEQRGPVASAKLRRAPTMQDRMLSELKAKMARRQLADMSKLEDLERRREVMFLTPNKQPADDADPSAPVVQRDDDLSPAPLDVVAKARLRATLVQGQAPGEAEKEIVPKEASQWPALKSIPREGVPSPKDDHNNNSNNNNMIAEPESPLYPSPADLIAKARRADDQVIAARQLTETRSLSLQGTVRVPGRFARHSSLDLPKGISRGATPPMWHNPLAAEDDVVEVEGEAQGTELNTSFDISCTSADTGDSTSTDSETGAGKEVDSPTAAAAAAVAPASKKFSRSKFLKFFRKADLGFFSSYKKDKSPKDRERTSGAISC